MSAEPVEPPRPSARPSSVARLADALRALGDNERTIADIRALVTRMEPTKLVPVAAELNLLAQLDDLAGQARRLIEESWRTAGPPRAGKPWPPCWSW